MKNYALGDTVVAISSPPGVAAVGLVRLSGPDAFVYANSLFRPAPLPGGRADDLPGRRRGAWNGTLSLPLPDAIASTGDGDGDGVGDRDGDSAGRYACPARLWTFPAPASYTRENVAEFHLPGSPALLRLVAEEFVRLGARPAAPGEFTARALRLGRLPPDAALAVGELVSATTEAARRAAAARLDPDAATRIAAWRRDLLAAAGAVEGALWEDDFLFSGGNAVNSAANPDSFPVLDNTVGDAALAAEAAGGDDKTGLTAPNALHNRLYALLIEAEANAGRARRAAGERGLFRVRLAGHVNAGKSALFNALTATDDAVLTSPVPGTTRDRLSRPVRWGGTPLILEDGPGWEDDPETSPSLPRPPFPNGSQTVPTVPDRSRAANPLDASPIPAASPMDDPLAEQRALRRLLAERAAAHWEGADLVLWCAPPWEVGKHSTPDSSESPFPFIPPCSWPATDDVLCVYTQADRCPNAGGIAPRQPCFVTSAVDGRGLAQLRRFLAEKALARAGEISGPSEAPWLKAAEFLREALRHLSTGAGLELVAESLRLSHDALAALLGESFEEDTLAHLFAGFCVGK